MKPTWSWQQQSNCDYLTITSWQANGVEFLFTGRNGGKSCGDFSSLNLGLHVGDAYEDVISNRRKVMFLLGQDLKVLVTAEQTHGAKVLLVNQEDRGKGAFQQSMALPETDALITDQPEVYLALFFADCIPLGFFDPVTKAIGLAHGGWKGTRQGIAVKTIEAMQAAYGTQPQDVEVVIGPGIGFCCFEIQTELAAQIQAELPTVAECIRQDGPNWFWDLKETNRKLLLQAGVLMENISDSKCCTACETDKFYSYRKENGHTGRMAAIIGIKE